MARQIRIDAPGLLHHVTSRGNERRKIFKDDIDCLQFLAFLAEAVRRFGWSLHSWVLMINHYHLVIETSEATLSEGMHRLNGCYAQWFNKRHRRVGHLFQGRFKSFHIEKEAYLMNVMRYVALNPVRCGLVARPEDYRWSSHAATAGFAAPPDWLTTGTVLGMIRPDRDEAQRVYREFVNEKIDDDSSIWDELVNQMFLGGEAWLAEMRALLDSELRSDDHPKAQRAVGRPSLDRIVTSVASVFDIGAVDVREGRGGAPRLLTAWLGVHEGMSRLRTVAATLRLRSSGYVSDLVRRCEREMNGDALLRDLADRCLALLRGESPGTRRGYWPAMPAPELIRDGAPLYR